MGLTTIIAKEQGTDGPEMVFLFCNTSGLPLQCGSFETIAEADAFATWAQARRRYLPGMPVRPDDVRSIPADLLDVVRCNWLDAGRPGYYDPGEDPDR